MTRMFGNLTKHMTSQLERFGQVQAAQTLNVDAQVIAPLNEYPALPVHSTREKVVLKRPVVADVKVQEPPAPAQEKEYHFVKIGDRYQQMEYECKGYAFLKDGVKSTFKCGETVTLTEDYIARKVLENPKFAPPARTHACKELNDLYYKNKQ